MLCFRINVIFINLDEFCNIHVYYVTHISFIRSQVNFCILILLGIYNTGDIIILTFISFQIRTFLLHLMNANFGGITVGFDYMCCCKEFNVYKL